MSVNARATAARVITDVVAGQSLNQALPKAVSLVAEKDRGLLQQLCYGTLRLHPMLTGLLQQLLDKPLRDKDKDVESLLLIGLFQLDAMRIPDHAAVAETVAATRALKKPWAKGLANALLRRYLRERPALQGQLDPAQLAAHTPWMYQKLEQQWPQQLSNIIKANNTQPPMTLRVNRRQLNKDQYTKQLCGVNIESTSCLFGPDAITLTTPVDVNELPGFAAGEVSVQDEAAQLAADVMTTAAGDRVLDICAAPGGKSCHILERETQLKELVSADVEPRRLQKVQDNLTRLRLQATLLTADGANPPETLQASSFDKILVDAPCSASGVIRRHPDVKLLRREADLQQFAEQQLAILVGVWPLLKEGGTLLYATCSVFEEENSAVVARFIASSSNATVQIPQAAWGVQCSHGRQILPSENGPDGLFYALIQKVP